MDVVTFGRDRPPRRRVGWWIILGAVVLAAGAVAVAVDRSRDNAGVAPSPPAKSPIGSAPCTTATQSADSIAALVVDPDHLGLGRTLERRDADAENGPWTAVVRRLDGSLGVHGAVVTFPVETPLPGRRVNVNGVAGTAVERTVQWPVSGSHARVRGDLSEAELLSIAEATSVINGRPVVQAIEGLKVVSTGPYRPTTINEVRYGTSTVEEEEALGDGLVYTGVLIAGGFEDQLYARQTTAGGVVQCHPAMMSTVLGGNATLAWEPYPGTVAYVGYSGSSRDADALAALHRIADRCRVLNAAEWRAARPDVRGQRNEFG
jgi:hypothetical protein